eukprot:3047777-Amphidinium_carterae.1
MIGTCKSVIKSVTISWNNTIQNVSRQPRFNSPYILRSKSVCNRKSFQKRFKSLCNHLDPNGNCGQSLEVQSHFGKDKFLACNKSDTMRNASVCKHNTKLLHARFQKVYVDCTVTTSVVLPVVLFKLFQ